MCILDGDGGTAVIIVVDRYTCIAFELIHYIRCIRVLGFFVTEMDFGRGIC